MSAHQLAVAGPRHLLDSYPLLRSRCADEACEQVGRALSPHRLDVHGGQRDFDARHNRIALREVTLNVLSYGSEVVIDPGERGDYYLVQLPMRGKARLSCGGQDALIDTGTLAVLQPHRSTRMLWSEDCTMLLLQVPGSALYRRMTAEADGKSGAGASSFALTQSRGQAATGAWWQATLDLASNLDCYGSHWLSQPAACASMEDFLLRGLAAMLQAGSESALAQGQGASPMLAATQERCVRRALDYMHHHAHESLCLDDLARAACVSARTLEVSFRRVHQQTPLVYLRTLRLDRVHQALLCAANERRPASVTELALQHGFVHMGRFSAYYKQRFGCAPSATLWGGQQAAHTIAATQA